jgi:FixJ family two-component response regulator
MVLPGMSGRDLAELLLRTRPGLKVVYISGYTGDETVRAGEFPPGSAFLQKPFTLGALTGKVREALDQP